MTECHVIYHTSVLLTSSVHTLVNKVCCESHDFGHTEDGNLFLF